MSKLGKIIAVFGSAGIVVPVYLMQSKSETFWTNITMPVLRCIDAEKAHKLAVKTASWGLVPKFTTDKEDQSLLKTSLVGLTFDSPVGLAAGFDKHAECYDGMLKMGFGFVEVGSITPNPQDGNAKPRVFRLPEDEAVINRYGFNSFGHQAAYDNLTKRKNQNGIVAVNLGKNKTSSDAVGDYVQGIMKFGELADYLVINISSPNTPGLRKMQGRKQLEELLKQVLDARDKLAKRKPLFVKISPDLTDADKKDIADVIRKPETHVDGLIISNTTITRPGDLKNANKKEIGGLSGKPLRSLSTQTIRDLYKLTEGKIPIIGVGGISNGEDAYEKICNGASLVQLYSALTLNGPPVVGKVKRELAELLRKDGFSSISQAVGCDLQEFHCPTENDFSDSKKAAYLDKESRKEVFKVDRMHNHTGHLGYIVTNIALITVLHLVINVFES